MTRHVEIAVGGFKWSVPYGFGRAFRDAMRNPAPPSVLSDLLRLIGYAADPNRIGNWSPYKRAQAEIYAAREHLSASDNPVRRLPRPDWMPPPWKGHGHEMGVDLFDDPQPTVLR